VCVCARAGVIFLSLLQLPSGITELDEKKQRRLCLRKFSKAQELSEVDTQRELECGICLEVNRKVVLPDCAHTLCMRCFQDWYGPFIQFALLSSPAPALHCSTIIVAFLVLLHQSTVLTALQISHKNIFPFGLG
jgi:hypothetical protein